MTDLVSTDGVFNFEEAAKNNTYFYHKTPVLKKVYAEFLQLQDRYPNDKLIEQCRRDFRQMLNDIDVCESAISELYKKAVQGGMSDDVVVDFVSLLWHWQGVHVDLRKFRQFIEKNKNNA